MTQLTLRAPVHLTNDETGSRPIPLDLAAAMPDQGRFDALMIRLDGLAPGAVLSGGRNNGDQSWTVGAHELKGLEYRPAGPAFADHSLTARVIGIVDGEESTVVGQFDLQISPDGRTPEVPAGQARTHKLVDLGRIKARAQGMAWAARTERGLAGANPSHFTELTRRLEEAEAQIAALLTAARSIGAPAQAVAPVAPLMAA
ncbi:MAG: hypothetical protein O7C63_01350 [Alphaproteobacteria bacterium]|nr:hypothetical protein [Alphaproteobacteria bacterium]MCZ6763560.1 hypothetical protein [Alphaproteobacteria bacterium]